MQNGRVTLKVSLFSAKCKILNFTGHLIYANRIDLPRNLSVNSSTRKAMAKGTAKSRASSQIPPIMNFDMNLVGRALHV